ncbi:MAG: lactate utilization protein [Crenarchaeota archaeon]|nr:lactate utilization protein [Thermoproteota archaeon]
MWRDISDNILRRSIERVLNILRSGYYDYINEITKVVREVKRDVIEKLDSYVSTFIESASKREIEVHLAETRDDVYSILRRIVSPGSLAVLSKSMVCEELKIRKFLINDVHCEVWETDIGELILQITDEVPSHITAPSLHVSRDRIIEALKKVTREEFSSDPEEIVKVIRRFLRDKYVRADVGITGANALAADTGSVLIVENEGNARLVSSLPRVHIVITGVEKIMPTILHAFLTCIVQCSYAGSFPSAYINIISGRSYTTDIERIRVSPAQGPERVHIVLVDNGRTRAREDKTLKEALTCVRCGRCLIHCPVYQSVGPGYGEPPYIGPMGVMWTAVTRGIDYAAKYADMCLGCGNCSKNCPMGIDIRRVIAYIRRALRQ